MERGIRGNCPDMKLIPPSTLEREASVTAVDRRPSNVSCANCEIQYDGKKVLVTF
jgi:hypothetical protein